MSKLIFNEIANALFCGVLASFFLFGLNYLLSLNMTFLEIFPFIFGYVYGLATRGIQKGNSLV